jgi:hypothetical protein
MPCAPNDPYRKTVEAAVGKRSVPPGEILVRDLPPTPRISSPVARVDYLVAEVLVVLVAAGQDDGVRAFSLASRDAGHGGAVHAGFG